MSTTSEVQLAAHTRSGKALRNAARPPARVSAGARSTAALTAASSTTRRTEPARSRAAVSDDAGSTTPSCRSAARMRASSQPQP